MEGYEMPEWMDLDCLMAMRQQAQDLAMFGDGEEFPLESIDAFSDEPLSFEEMAAGLREDLEEVFTLTRMINRFSPEYPKVSLQLENLIRQVGRCCMTKAVLEQNGIGLPKLQELELQDLYNMVSLNYRKTRSAYQDSVRLKGCADMKLLDLESRWVSLADRLRSTEEKIRLIRDGKVDTGKMLERTKLFPKEAETQEQKKRKERRNALAKARALPVIGSVARQMIAERKAEERAEREAEKAQRESVRGAFGNIQPFGAPAVFRPSKSMMELANRDKIPDLIQRSYDPPGPSEATRKKLRNKRKKRNKS